MKKVILMLILIVASCKTAEHKATALDKEDILLTYSKGPCLGKCPVYDIKVLKDGMLVYKGVDKVKNKGSVLMRLSSEELADLMTILKNVTESPQLFKKVRDRPVTVLKFNEKKYEFHASQIDGALMNINSRIENLVAQVNTK